MVGGGVTEPFLRVDPRLRLLLADASEEAFLLKDVTLLPNHRLTPSDRTPEMTKKGLVFYLAVICID